MACWELATGYTCVLGDRCEHEGSQRRGAFWMGARRTCRSCVDHAPFRGAHLEAGQDDEYVWHDSTSVGSCDSRLAHYWINPAGDHREEQIGRWSGKNVVQVGVRPDGTPTRWMFSEITTNSFHWTGEALNPDGHTWRLEGDFRVTRMR